MAELVKFLFTVPEAAASLGICPRLVWQFLKRGELRPTRLGKRTLIHRDLLERFARRDHEGMSRNDEG